MLTKEQISQMYQLAQRCVAATEEEKALMEQGYEEALKNLEAAEIAYSKKPTRVTREAYMEALMALQSSSDTLIDDGFRTCARLAILLRDYTTGRFNAVAEDMYKIIHTFLGEDATFEQQREMLLDLIPELNK